MKSKKTNSLVKKLSELFSCKNLENNRCNQCCFKIICDSCECEEDTCDDDRCICDVIESIALMEAGLAHILNAEGEKLQKAIQLSDNVCDLLAINQNVTNTIKSITDLECLLNRKLDNALSREIEGGGNCGNYIR